MSQTLQQRIDGCIRKVLETYPGAWLVWCDPQGEWERLLQRVAEANNDTKGFPLLVVSERISDEPGSPLMRRQLQERISAGESFVLYIRTGPDRLGWLWAQVLRAEGIYSWSLRHRLREWGWRQQNIKTTDEELVELAKQYLHLDPADWGGGGLQPDPGKLLDVLAAGNMLQEDDRPVLELTIEAAGLPSLDANEPEVDRWRTFALASLLVTQDQQTAPELLGEGHEYLIKNKAKRDFALTKLFSPWRDSMRLRRGLHERLLEADHITMLGNYVEKATIQHNPFLSYSAEYALFATTCRRLNQISRKELLETFASMYNDLQLHAQSFWGDLSEMPHNKTIPWGELARLSRAAQILLAATPNTPWTTPADAIYWYTQKGWQIDKAGEEFLRHLGKSTRELLDLIKSLRSVYNARWENYMLQWSELWMEAGCPTPQLSSQGEWLQDQLKHKDATAVIIIDALRYDLGMILAEQVNKHEGTARAQVSPARTALPTITALGMGMALPINECELQAELVNGKWQLMQKGYTANLSIAEQRREWLRRKELATSETLLTVIEVEAGNIPKPQDGYSRLVVFDDMIDKLGHDEELEAIGTEQVQQRYMTIIDRLRDNGWLHVLIVTDHGFIHLPNSEYLRVSPPLANPVYSSRRALAYPASVSFPGSQGLAPGGKWRIAVPSGAACFRTYGGLGFFHGGASLQEWIVPCIKVEWPSHGKPVNVVIQPIEKILSRRPKIVLHIDRGGTSIEDALARDVEISIKTKDLGQTLFEAKNITLTPDQDQVPITLWEYEEKEKRLNYSDESASVKAERGTELVIEVRDTQSQNTLTTETTILMVTLEDW